MAVCVAVVGRDNQPLYLRTLPHENALQYHYLVHTSLDIIQERVASAAQTAGQAKAGHHDPWDQYLGLLHFREDFRVYGYVTNTRVKLVLVVEAANPALQKDADVRAVFKRLQAAYIRLVCSAFYTPGEQIVSRLFNDEVANIMSPD
ncbi:hypothetical protein BOX15_Mlig022834g2 [Macrostomum lignano]|uniref:Trafficking protein particle complex subunit 2-like protein n=1 Tax=Macrostomum lignano TaxID=282301 RepID=A0A267FZ44_9PLAT|nr:hypothetical protein BOX15_Mlig023014g1 [Macrostomum lignano]PAA78357.1 hypothetical protein BOX15_Mlig022834g2 [Macrostomum lignano]